MNNPDVRVLYSTSEMFVNDILEAIRSSSVGMATLRAKYRDADVLLLDDVQVIEGKESSSEEFRFTLDALIQNGKQVVLSANKSPSELKKFDDYLRSRLVSGIVVNLGIPDWPRNENFIREKASGNGLLLDDGAVEYIGQNSCTSLFELEGALTNLKAYYEQIKPVITLDIAKAVLMTAK